MRQLGWTCTSGTFVQAEVDLHKGKLNLYKVRPLTELVQSKAAELNLYRLSRTCTGWSEFVQAELNLYRLG